ncbi:MAG: hypothetical protein IKY00_07190 [Clostridia bacterium]|nr:hypothetical protein [Clostridia bacterium]
MEKKIVLYNPDLDRKYDVSLSKSQTAKEVIVNAVQKYKIPKKDNFIFFKTPTHGYKLVDSETGNVLKKESVIGNDSDGKTFLLLPDETAVRK